MCPKLAGVPAYSIFYTAGIVLHLILCLVLARRLCVEWRARIAVLACYLFGMTVGAKALYDLRVGGFSFAALAQPSHYAAGGLWGGPLVYLALSVPLAWLLSTRKRAALDLTVLTLPAPRGPRRRDVLATPHRKRDLARQHVEHLVFAGVRVRRGTVVRRKCGLDQRVQPTRFVAAGQNVVQPARNGQQRPLPGHPLEFSRWTHFRAPPPWCASRAARVRLFLGPLGL